MISIAELAKTVMDAIGDDMPAELCQKVLDMRKEMEECKAVLRQHLEDSFNLFSKSLSEFHRGVHLQPVLVDSLISDVRDNRRQKMFKREHELHLRSIILFMGHIVRLVVQRPMQGATLE